MKKYVFVAGIAMAMSFQASARDYLINKSEYISELRTSCDIKVYKDLTMTIDVVCGSGGGSCSGHTVDGYFACNTFSGASGNVNGVSSGVNWILNNM